MKNIIKNTKIIHISIIVLGIIFISLSAFHNSIWFDESYSVAISNHSFGEIWTIGGHDVHPVLYYWILHIIRAIFGNQIILFKLFSVVAFAILGIIGYTHIRKDFGEKVGILFSFFVFFLPLNVIYAGQVRMYPLAMLLVTLTAIYAYRIFAEKENCKTKNWILFALFSLSAAYTHYYALAAAVVINLLLLIYLVIQSVRKKKITKNLKAFIIAGMLQILAYLPWLMYLLLQASQVSSGYWIEFQFPETLIEMFTFQFVGNLQETKYMPDYVAIIFGLLICVSVLFLLYRRNRLFALYSNNNAINTNNNIDKKQKEIIEICNNTPAKLAISVYILVVLAVCIVSIVIGRSILYARYLLCITGLLIFFISFILGRYGNKYIISIICVFSIILASYTNLGLIKTNYDESNSQPIDYLKQNIQEGDILVYGNEGEPFVVSANFPDVKQYFWDEADWKVDEAYKAYGPNMEIIHSLESLEDYKGRVWVINRTNYAIADSIERELNGKVIEKRAYQTAYENYPYTITLMVLE